MKERLERIQKLNEEKKIKKNRLEGKLESAEMQMKEYGCNDLNELEQLIEKMKKELKQTELELDEKLGEMEKYVQE